MQTQTDFNFEDFQKEVIKGLYSGKPLTGENGIFAPMLKHFLEQSLQGEMDAHLTSERANGTANRRNGVSVKRVKSNAGEFELQTPRDRLVNFEPSIVSEATSSADRAVGRADYLHVRTWYELLRDRQTPSRNLCLQSITE